MGNDFDYYMKIKNEISKVMLKYTYALNILETELNILISEYEFSHHYNPVEHIKSRIKSTDSIIRKLENKGFDLIIDNIDNLHDIVGIRIVCSFLSDVHTIVDLIEKSNNIVVKKKKDFINEPKSTGYTSYHLIVSVPIYLSSGLEMVDAEIQIRTVAMDFWASLNHKIQYKFPKEIPDEIKNELYDYSLELKNMDVRLDTLHELLENYAKDDKNVLNNTQGYIKKSEENIN